jgi:hypothetical protein
VVEPHPVRLVVTDDLHRSRLTVFFRLLLAIPHLIWVGLWGIAVFFVLLVNWFATLVKGRSPDGLHNFEAHWLRYATHVSGYAYLLANPYPRFSGTASYPIDLEVDPPAGQNRLTVLFRAVLAIPAYILAYVLGYVLEVIAVIAWFACLILGRLPEGMRNLAAYCLNYYQQTTAYCLLLTSRYPSLSFTVGQTGAAPPPLGGGAGELPASAAGELEPPGETTQ